jgi:hypothetical protein
MSQAISMAAPRKYSDAQRAAMFGLYRRGCTPAEIARRCAAGTSSVAPFEIPRRTVHSIVSAMHYEVGEPTSGISNGRSLELRLKDLTKGLLTALECEMERIERREAVGRPVDGKTAAELSRCIKILAPLAKDFDQIADPSGVRSGCTAEAREEAQEETLSEQLLRQMQQERPDTQNALRPASLVR